MSGASRYFRRAEGGRWIFWCPGCEELHQIGGAWTVVELPDGRLSVDPSILVQGGREQRRCHSYLRDGRWEFLTDSTHALAGQFVAMVELPEYLQE